MVAYPFQMPSGIPGAITRPEQSTVEQSILDQTTPPLLLGVPVKKVANRLQPITTGDVPSSIVGILVRDYPTSGNGTDGLGVGTPNKALPASLLKRGYISAALSGATAAAAEAQVYTRVQNPVTGQALGDVEADNDVSVTSPAIVGTGTGTIAASVSDATKIQPGTYVLTLQTTSNTSLVTVIDPNGKRLKDATVGTAYTDEGLTFTITAAGTMTAGDTFSPVVTQNTIPIPNAKFTGGADASGNVEIAYNI